MARVTVEDCVRVVPNRFELVLLTAQRARDIAAGMQLTVDRDNDKNAVVALREIAEQTVDFEELRRHIAKGVHRHSDMNFEDDALMNLIQESMSEEMGGAPDDGSSTEIKELEFEDDAEPKIIAEPVIDEIEAVAEEVTDTEDTQAVV